MQLNFRDMLNNDAFDYVTKRLELEGFEAFAVGGCVRDAVRGVPFNDVDIATNARPHDLTKAMGVGQQWDGDGKPREGFHGVKLYPTGVAHGTWTVRVGEYNVEVTTFRKDVATDGRRATVEFADTIAVDAQRRDFTMNALYMNRRGAVYDPTGTGVVDLQQGVVRFVGDADARVKEDYLRILRLFRFHARFGRGPMDRDAWEAAKRGAAKMMENVSGERVWDELKKLLSLHNPMDALLEMAATGVLYEVFGRRKVSETFFHVMAGERNTNTKPDSMARYVALRGDGSIPYPASNAEKKVTEAMWASMQDPDVSNTAACAHKYGADAAVFRGFFFNSTVKLSEVQRGVVAKMPLTAADLMEIGREGKMLGQALEIAKACWYATDLRASKETLLSVAR